MAEPDQRVPLGTLCGVFFRIGLFSFGGGVAAWLHRETVVLRRWLTNDDFMAGLALSQVLPGVNVSNMTIYIGERLRGAVGAAASLAAVLAGPFVLILALAEISDRLKDQPIFHAGMEGVAAAAVGLVLNVGVVGARRFVPRLTPTLVMAATFVAIGLFHFPLFVTVAVIAPASVLLAYVSLKPSEK